MHKAYQFDGQFWVSKVNAAQDDVPIDNFIFRTTKGIDVTLETHGNLTSVSWRYREKYKCKWHDTTAQALRTMADVLEGKVSFEGFCNGDEVN